MRPQLTPQDLHDAAIRTGHHVTFREYRALYMAAEGRTPPAPFDLDCMEEARGAGLVEAVGDTWRLTLTGLEVLVDLHGGDPR